MDPNQERIHSPDKRLAWICKTVLQGLVSGAVRTLIAWALGIN
ncbi:hypothetical protein [Mycobacterium sp. 1245852.3]|nr:hypothetical protein [Mycobacterium sp. 1245852.3]